MKQACSTHTRPRSLFRVSVLLLTALTTLGQELLDWEASKKFQYNIEEVIYSSENRTVTVTYSVTDPTQSQSPWLLPGSLPFSQSPSLSRLAVAIGWATSEYSNTGGSGGPAGSLAMRPFGAAPAAPISINALRPPAEVSPGHYRVSAVLPPQASGSGVVALEGHPAWPAGVDDAGNAVYARVPVKSVYQYFAITDSRPVERREVVTITKCQQCHDGRVHGDVEVPRLTLHGANRTEELHVCVICHNPNQTDAGYRTSGAEESMDFKRMVHSIHGAKKRETAFVVVGFQGAVSDFSHVRFPAETSDCVKCHLDDGIRGTFELPLPVTVKPTTVASDSALGVGPMVDVDPANDRKMSPTVAVCSSCHDKEEDLEHMASRRSGGKLWVLQADISNGTVVIRERCVDCHGRGREKDVRKVHALGHAIED